MTGRLLAALLLLAPATPAPLAPGPHEVTVNGVRLWYRVAGAPVGEPVVFLHGGPGEGSNAFQRYAGPALERRGLRMVYLDQRGSGRSERPASGRYSQDLLVDDLERLRRALGVPRLALIGHSYGTVIAMEYAARYPARVSRLVLTGAVPDMPAAFTVQCARLQREDPEAYARAAERVAPGVVPPCSPFRAYRGPAMQQWVNRNMFPDPATDRMVNEADTEDGMRNTGELSRAILNGGFLDYRFAGTARLTMPVLVVAGGKDYQAVIEPQRDLVHRLPRGRMLEYPNNGHFMFVEAPERFAADVSGFLGAGARGKR